MPAFYATGSYLIIFLAKVNLYTEKFSKNALKLIYLGYNIKAQRAIAKGAQPLAFTELFQINAL